MKAVNLATFSKVFYQQQPELEFLVGLVHTKNHTYKFFSKMSSLLTTEKKHSKLARNSVGLIGIQSMPEIQCEALSTRQTLFTENVQQIDPLILSTLPTCASKQKLIGRRTPSKLTTINLFKIIDRRKVGKNVLDWVA